MFANAFIIKSRAKRYINRNPNLKEGYEKLFKKFLIYGNIPWLIMGIGDLTGLTKSIFDFFTPQQLNPIVVAFHASVILLWIIGSYWIYFNKGAEFLAQHPGFFNFSEPSKTDNLNKNKVRFFWALMMIGGVISERTMWSWDISLRPVLRTEHSHLVYDFSDRLPRFGSMLFPLVFVVVGIGTYFYHKKFVDNNSTMTFGIKERRYGMVFGIIFSSVGGLISVIVIPSMLNEYSKTRSVYDKKQYQTIEGTVENFHPMPVSGHDSERFTVNGIQFEFSDFDETNYGYNNAASHGGVIREGLQVRIGYFNNGRKNVILKLETQ